MLARRATVFAALSAALAIACARGATDPLVEEIAPTEGEPAASLPGADASAGGDAGASRDGDSDDGASPDGNKPDAAPTAPASGTTVTGAASGITIAPAHAAAVVVASLASVDRVVVVISTRPGFCADYAGGVDHAGDKSLAIAVVAKGLFSSVGPATYTIGTNKPSSTGGSFDTSARVAAYDSQCKSTVAAANESATSGTVTLSAVAPSGIKGTFSLTYPGGGSLSGTLDATVCTSPGADTFVCMP